MNRVFRLTFNHTAGKFVIEIQGFAGLSWKAVREGSKVCYFDTFNEAVDHVKKIGLDKVYADFTFQRPFGAPELKVQTHDYHKAIPSQTGRFGPTMWVSNSPTQEKSA